MRPDTVLRYTCALAFLLSSGWGTSALAQQARAVQDASLLTTDKAQAERLIDRNAVPAPFDQKEAALRAEELRAERARAGDLGCTELDFCEDFNATAVGAIPDGWANVGNGVGDDQPNAIDWEVTAGTEADGNVAFSIWQDIDDGEFDCSVEPESCAQDYLATPALELGMGASLQFDISQSFGTSYGSIFTVAVSTASQDNLADYTPIATYSEDDFDTYPTLQTITLDLSAYAGETVYISFGHINDDGDRPIIDDVGVNLGETGGDGCEEGSFCEDFEMVAVGSLPDGWAAFGNGIGDGETDQQDWQVIDDASLGLIAQSRYQNVDDVSIDCSVEPESCAQDYLATPALELGMGASLQFDAAEFFGTVYGSIYLVTISTASQTNPADYTVLATYSEDDFPDNGDGAATFNIDLSAYAGETAYIGFGHINEDGDNFMLDNVVVDLGEGGGGEQVSLPITFEDGAVDYELIDFPDDGSGPASMLVADPTDATNTVVQSAYPAEPACFAGTTVAGTTGFDMPIPFAEGETFMNVRVWSPEAGVRVRLKVEKFDDPTISVESDEFTTVAGAWETLEYDFSDEVPGTAAINFDSEYTKASIFFGFSCGVDPTAMGGNTYYWDDLAFGPASMGEMTIADARAAGDGADVTVTGTVTRAMGDFAYIQDETAGLTIRQVEGDFFDDVADGTIEPGTEVTVSGTLSTFRGLLQINEGDLTSYTVGDDGDVPAPQMISVQELLDNGEDYEAELVQIDDLTTDATGMFAASTNYDVTDETNTGTLRVPNADDSMIDGTDIPEGAFTFTGVVGQFTFADPANDGYQLLAIAEGDVEAQGPVGAISFDPSPLVEELGVGETGTETVTVMNNTEGDVAFDFSQYSSDDGRAEPTPRRDVSTARQLGLEKGDVDPRDNFRGEGGPDAFGYSWIDSNEAGGPAFEAIDIEGTGTAVTLLQSGCSAFFPPEDEGYADVDLPFTFSYYGVDYTTVRIWANGYVSFDIEDLPSGQCGFGNDPIPTDDLPNNIVAPLWDDFNGEESTGSILTETLADGRFVIQFNDWERFGSAQDGLPNTFQAILSPSGAIKFQYLELNGTSFSYSIGIENADASIGLEVAMGDAYAEEGLAVLISAAPTFVTGVSPATGTIPAGGSVDVDVTFDATGLIGGSYEGTLVVETDLESDPNTFELPVTLLVTGTADCMLTLDGDFADTIIGTTSEVTATVTNMGTDSCSLVSAAADNDAFSIEGFESTTLNPSDETSFTVVFTPTEAGDATGTLTVETDGEDLTAALSALGQDPPTPQLSATDFDLSVDTGTQTSDTFTLSNIGGEDAADLEYEITVVEARPAPAHDGMARTAGVTGRKGDARGAKSSPHRIMPEKLPEGPFAQTAEPIRGGDGNVVQDGSFEDGTPNAFWTEASASFGTPLCDETSCGLGGGSGPFDGDWWTWFGGSASGDEGSIEQDIEIPAGQAMLTFYLEIPVELTGTGFMSVLMDGEEVFSVNEGDFGSYDTYTEVMVDVSDYADGGTHTLRFESVTSGGGNFFVDLVSIVATGPALVSVDPDSGSIEDGNSDEITINVDASETPPGTYAFELLITTNDPNNPTLTVDVTVEVTGDIANEDGAIPTEFMIDQNYPNPFASATTIEYGLPEAERVTIDVYDAVGRHVVTLVDEDKTAGYHEANWNANGIASGLYVYRIQAGENTRTLKMVVVR